MSLVEKMMSMIGMEPANNRDVIMEELVDMTDEEFDRFLGDNPEIDQKVSAVYCEECKARHGGECPRPGDDDRCEDVFSRVTWLSQPATREHIITEG